MSEIETDGKHRLEIGTILKEHYRIEDVLGEGGFGITYEAVELNKNRRVAIKEYFPKGYAFRSKADLDANLLILDGTDGEEYRRGLDRFISEAKVLEQIRQLEGIVTILEHFAENQTAYIVMEYIDGVTLKQYVEENGPIGIQELLELLKPVMCSLGVLHKKGVIHRDISPDNLMIDMQNHMHLIDFGSARQAISKGEQTMTVILKNGYAPPEQYVTDGVQGAWTDVYALSATIYMALTGVKPPDAIERLQKKCLQPPSCYGADITWWQWKALEYGMKMQISERCRSMGQLYTELTIAPSIEETVTEYSPILTKRTRQKIKRVSKSMGENASKPTSSVTHPIHKKRMRRIGEIIIVLLVVAMLGLTVLHETNFGRNMFGNKVREYPQDVEKKPNKDATDQVEAQNKDVDKEEMTTTEKDTSDTQENKQMSTQGDNASVDNETGSTANQGTKTESQVDTFRYIEEDDEVSFELGE